MGLKVFISLKTTVHKKAVSYKQRIKLDETTRGMKLMISML